MHRYPYPRLAFRYLFGFGFCAMLSLLFASNIAAEPSQEPLDEHQAAEPSQESLDEHQAAEPSQESLDDEPPVACIAILLVDVNPATVEWAFWLGVGGGVRALGEDSSRALYMARLGANSTFGLATFGGDRYGGEYELRWGPWIGAETHFDGGLAQGGLELSLGQVVHAQWGTYSLRLGGGYAKEDGQAGPLLSLGLLGGVRSVPGRYSYRGACDSPASAPKHALASGARLFVNLRVPADNLRGSMTLLAGLEFDPAFFFPPYSLSRLIGAAP